jgi:hypothetical protein
MNWNVISASADVFAAVGVILSLIYLALQIRTQVKESRLSATRDLARDWSEGVRFIAGDDQNFAIYRKATANYENLSGDDRIKAYMMLSQLMRVIEIQHFHVTRGNLEPTLFEAMEFRIKEVGGLPGMRQWWNISKAQYNDEFIKYYEQISRPE